MFSEIQLISFAGVAFYIVMVVLAGTFFKADKDFQTTKLGMWNAHLYLKRPGQIMVYIGTIPLIGAILLTLLSLGS